MGWSIRKHLAKLAKQYDAETNAATRDAIGLELTRERLRKAHEDEHPEQPRPASKSAVNMGALIKQLEDNFDQIEDPLLKQQAGETITHARLVQQAEIEQVVKTLGYVSQVAATNEQNKGTQGRATSPSHNNASEARGSLVDAFNSRVAPESLGSPTGANQGDVTGHTGKLERDPVVVAATREDEAIQKAQLEYDTTKSQRRANELGEQLAYMRLVRLQTRGVR